MEMGKWLKALSDRIDEFDGRAATKQEIEELRDEIVELNKQVAALTEAYQALSPHMPAPM